MTHYLLDTNILLRSRDRGSSEYSLVNRAIEYLLSNDHTGCITSQVIVEFWVVATRPIAANGLGWTLEETEQATRMLIDQFEWLEETSEIFSRWFNLVTIHKISGKRTHDIRIQAVMLTHSISHILTLNPRDFIEIEEITIVHPNQLIER